MSEISIKEQIKGLEKQFRYAMIPEDFQLFKAILSTLKEFHELKENIYQLEKKIKKLNKVIELVEIYKYPWDEARMKSEHDIE